VSTPREIAHRHLDGLPTDVRPRNAAVPIVFVPKAAVASKLGVSAS
jgi:hypothetical protein